MPLPWLLIIAYCFAIFILSAIAEPKLRFLPPVRQPLSPDLGCARFDLRYRLLNAQPGFISFFTPL